MMQQIDSQSDPKSFTTLSDVVHQLGEKLGFDLSHKAVFIRDQINLLLFRSQSHYHNPPPPPPPPPQPSVPQPPTQVQPLPEVKTEGGVVVQDAVGKSSEKAKKGGSAGTKRRGGPGGLNKLCGITPELQVIVGESALSRTDIVKQLWAYIKKNNLQDPGNKRKIICDDALRVVFETDCTDMFKMNKLLAKHIIRLEPTKESSRKRSKVKVEPIVEPKAESTDNVPCQVIISDALANCLGTGEREMSQSEALRLVWEYIKVNNLEDPQNPVMILCDAKLRELFGCESISAMGIPDGYSRRLWKAEDGDGGGDNRRSCGRPEIETVKVTEDGDGGNREGDAGRLLGL
ncbi:DEK, C-terminal [Cynara cardunculus var. scolymus]|uniref:DEK, C-terminal n=1 Tax=Cynara cardunculus var. scolymus TaxID=59895 RepID=A0A103Y239_CYNCS|nr:DEK, C-terminal [Cynara cardunculus var. scolymus]